MDEHTTMSPLLRHLQKYAGKYVGCEPVYRGTVFQRYLRGYFEAWEGDTLTMISSGIRSIGRGPVVDVEEVACSLLSSQAAEAGFLVDAACEMIVDRQYGIEVDCVIDNGGSFVEDSPVEGLLASANPYFDLDFNIHVDKWCRVIVQVLTLLPVRTEEINLIIQRGADAVYALWEWEKTDLRDVYRRSSLRSSA